MTKLSELPEPRRAEIEKRIESEREYHDRHYSEKDYPVAVNFDLAESQQRRPHNLTWAYYDTILDRFNRNVQGKRILVIGCGTGAIALNLARNGAIVDGIDLSDKAVDICKRRSDHYELTNANFFVSSCEDLNVQSAAYDAVVGEMILHHVDIPMTIENIYQTLRPGGVGVFMEWKEYAIVDSIRSWGIFRRLFQPGGYSGYATEDERKLNAEDFRIIRTRFPDMELDFRYCIRGKLDYFFSPEFCAKSEKLDYRLLRSLPFIRPFTDGVIISFTKSADG